MLLKKKKRERKSSARREHSPHECSLSIQKRNSKKKKKRVENWGGDLHAGCRQGDPLAPCPLPLCQRKFCPRLGSSALHSRSALCCGSGGLQARPWAGGGALHAKAPVREPPAKQWLQPQVPLWRQSVQPPRPRSCRFGEDEPFPWPMSRQAGFEILVGAVCYVIECFRSRRQLRDSYNCMEN